MFIHGFEGSWLKHPFWRSRFLLERPADLALLRTCDVTAVVIDLSRGVGPDPSAPPPPPPAPMFLPEPLAEAVKADRDYARRTIARAHGVARGIYENAGQGRPIDAREATAVVAEIADCVARNPGMFVDMARLKSKDEYTYLHSVSVCGLMVNLARQIGLDEAAMRAMGLAGLLHDVGKTSVPATVLNKPGRLDDAEFAMIKRHPEAGHAMLRGAEGINQEALDVCLMHHEKMDGSGYPFGLKGAEISLAARMGAICDVFDALTSDRAYKDRWTPLRAVTEMFGWTGHFDPELMFQFCRSIGVAPTGLLVRMASGRLGVVLPDGGQGLRSMVRLFYSAEHRRMIPLEDIFRGMKEVVVGLENPADWGFSDWDAAVRLLSEGHNALPDSQR
ncbi:putative nucleotidyltransferase with HDIG domain [Sphingomonas kyeonggiensis]|uniref:Putative nucleotidyltransferase with HDIG domain n=2 Tax=Sphingomonas kyeonggiensis TaxID=1268553 RepID=A0A7W7NS64_9SPHN|nr:putative nucleotidyltransferase with HDIG domain [Sphingomonas kyeonggiensis]